MNSTNLPHDDEPVFDRDVVFYLGRTALAAGCITELILIVFFCANVFFTAKKNYLNSAYFKITVIGYIVDVISSGSLVISDFVDPAYVTTYSNISMFTIVYSDLHLGWLLALMGVNRCTTLAFPVIHKKIWEGYPFYIIILLFIAAPFIIGHKYLFDPCVADFWKPKCALFIIECYFRIICINLPLLCLTLITVFVGVWFSRKQTSLADFKKAEKRLVWQTISSSTFLICYYVLYYLGGVFYDQSPEFSTELYSISVMIYTFHNHPSIVILFVVSKTFRRQFTTFYGCKSTTFRNKKIATAVIGIQGYSVVISPDSNLFVLRNLNKHYFNGNVTRSSIYIQDGCIYNTDQLLTAKIGEQSYSLPLYPSIQNLHCAVALRVVQERVMMEKPFVDIVVYRDHSWMSTFKQKLCVTTGLKNSEGKLVKGSCVFNESDAFLNACLIRQEIPLSWFKINGHAKQWTTPLTISYSVGSQCLNPQRTLTNQKINLVNAFDKMHITSLSSHEFGQISLMARPNLTFVPESPESVFLHFRNDDFGNSNTTTNLLKKIEIKLWIDSRLEISSAIALEPDLWNLKTTSMTPPTFHTSFTLTNLATKSRQLFEDHLLALVLKLKPTKESSFSSEFEFSKIISLHWAIQFYFYNGKEIPETRIATKFTIGPDKSYAIAPVSRGFELINTAVISGIQASVPMRVFSVTLGGRVKDVTDGTHCISSEPRLLKTSPTCTSVFVDGSEMRGNAAIEVHVQFRTLSSTAIFTVWYPKLPITVWVSDPVLNAVNEWRITTLKDLSSRKIRDARQFACKNRHQQTEIRVLAAFHVVDEATGERIYLAKDKDLMFDVTQLAVNRIQSVDPSVLMIKKKNGRLIGIPKKSGITRLVLKALAPAIDYGSVLVTVTEDRVSPTQLLIKPIANVNLQLLPEVDNPLQYELVTRIQSTFTHQYQHGTAEVYIFYSDGQRELLSDVDTKEFSLSVYSSDDNLLRINQQRSHPSVELVALGDGSEITLTVEIHCPTYCEDAEAPPIVSGQTLVQLFFGDSEPGIGFRTTRMDQLTASNMTILESNLQEKLNLQPILVVLLTLVFIIGLFHLVTGHRGLHNGYEKLVVPLLAKLNSSNSISEGGDESDDVKEWVWLSKDQIDDKSLSSRYSQRSTLEVHDKKSRNTVDETSHKNVSISYRGSEISVFIAPQPSVAVHEDPRMSASLHIHDRSRNKEVQNFSSTSMLRNSRPERRISDHSAYFRTQNQHFIEPHYQSIGHPKRSRYDGTQRQFANPGEFQRSRISYPMEYTGLGFRESIA